MIRGRSGWICGVLASVVATAAAAAPARLQVQSINIAERGPATCVDLRLSRPGDFELFTLSEPNRVVLDIAAAALGPTALPLPTAIGAIRQIRVAHRPGGSLRIVFDLAEAMQPRGTLGTDGAVSRLSIELRPTSWVVGAPVAPDAAASSDLLTALANTAPRAQAEPVAKPRRPGRDLVVAVDAGHGGHDPGARGPSGLREKDVTLAISRRLVDLINRQPGMRAVLTRSDDRFVVLRQRMERARSASADLFISVHADAAFNRMARGSTVYALSEKAASDEASRRLAARENAALIGGVELGNKDPVLASVLMDLSQNASISSSIAVGNAILGQMATLGHLHRHSVQQAPFMVLKSPDVPSVLIETAYISNPDDERNLRSPRHQQALAQAILGGVRHYFDANPPQGTLVAATPVAPTPEAVEHVIRPGDTLSGVASRYNVTVQRIRAVNGLRTDAVRIGQTLRIPTRNT